ncbi:MAG: hypothetical protein E4G89_02775 [Methanothrix sp.]|nr:MAG: hypothetical protein E4G89_02775 [Methanothrix sp.]
MHDDATPNNYLLPEDRCYALDFEHSRDHAHPVHDLGIMCAELKKYFIINRMDPRLAEPYIEHLLSEYSRDQNELDRIRESLPYFMSLGFLRIANCRMDPLHRSLILNEALASIYAKRF